MTARERGLKRGREAGAGAGRNYQAAMQAELASCRILFPTMKEDMAAALIECDRQRLACEPDYAKFPELRGHADLLRAERQAFREVTGFGNIETAYQFSWWYFRTRWLECRHLARWDIYLAQGCTNVFIPDGRDGVTISDNRDIGLPDDLSELAKWRPDIIFERNRNGVYFCQGGVSSAVVLDDEPSCSFPADPFTYDHLIPPEFYDDIDVMIEFLTRFNEFWGPGNKLLVDSKMRAVICEKTNCLVAWRKAGPSGAVAITACAYLDRKLHEHQMERCRKAAAIKGETIEDSTEINYHQGSRKRYRRLTELTERAAMGKPGIWDALAIVADHAVPYPDRVCLAGESKNSTKRNPRENWSVVQFAAVISDPYRRAIYRSVQSRAEPRPVYEYTPKLMLAAGVKMRPEWQADIDAGRCELAAPWVPLSN